MNLPTWYDTGTVSVAAGETTVTGLNTFWGGDAIMVGDLFCDPLQPLVPPQRVKSVTDNGELELWAPWPGAGILDSLYEIRYVGMIERSTAQSRKVLEQLGEISAYFDVQVDTIADRDALETASKPLQQNYRVLVSNNGETPPKSVIFSKVTSVYGDWSEPALFTGPEGQQGPVGPRGVNWRGAYDAGAAYAINDGVTYNGSSFRKLTVASAGNAPSSANPPVSNANWEVLAARGINGAGTVNAVAAGTGISVNSADPTAPVVALANVATSTIKGRISAGAGAPEDLTATQARSLLGQAWEQIGPTITLSGPVASIEWLNLSIYRRLRLSGKCAVASSGDLYMRMGAGSFGETLYNNQTLDVRGTTVSAAVTVAYGGMILAPGSDAGFDVGPSITAEFESFGIPGVVTQFDARINYTQTVRVLRMTAGAYNQQVALDRLQLLAVGQLTIGTRLVLEGLRL